MAQDCDNNENVKASTKKNSLKPPRNKSSCNGSPSSLSYPQENPPLDSLKNTPTESFLDL